jgi:hypothetical protein
MTTPKRFCLAHLILPFGTVREDNAQCTHLKITQTNPQSEIFKRVQLSDGTKYNTLF